MSVFCNRRLTLWLRSHWARSELVGFPASSHPAIRDVAKTYVLQVLGLLLARSVRGPAGLADVSIGGKNDRSTTLKFYWKRGRFSSARMGVVDK